MQYVFQISYFYDIEIVAGIQVDHLDDEDPMCNFLVKKILFRTEDTDTMIKTSVNTHVLIEKAQIAETIEQNHRWLIEAVLDY